MIFDVLPEKFLVMDGDRIRCQPCLNFAFFAPHISDGSRLDGALDVFLGLFGESVDWYRSDFHQMHPKRLSSAKRVAILDTMRAELANIGKGAVVELHAGGSREEWSLPAWSLTSAGGEKAYMSLAIQLPLSWLESSGVDGVEAFLDQLLGAGLPMSHGYIGLGLMWNPSWGADMAALGLHFYQWLGQHPGLTNPCVLSQKDASVHGVVDIGWITLLGKEFAEKAGGAEQIAGRIQSQLLSQISIRPLPGNGLAIRAGELPKYGDKTNGDDLPLQRAVGGAIRSLWDEDRSALQVIDGFPRDPQFTEQRHWASRFFD